ncbi:MAG: hypothetical protein LBI69_03920 [Puniceicoccales bacterium]|nr:hypothetical protein [Puniceicoccales bacterium]
MDGSGKMGDDSPNVRSRMEDMDTEKVGKPPRKSKNSEGPTFWKEYGPVISLLLLCVGGGLVAATVTALSLYFCTQLAVVYVALLSGGALLLWQVFGIVIAAFMAAKFCGGKCAIIAKELDDQAVSEITKNTKGIATAIETLFCQLRTFDAKSAGNALVNLTRQINQFAGSCEYFNGFAFDENYMENYVAKNLANTLQVSATRKSAIKNLCSLREFLLDIGKEAKN